MRAREQLRNAARQNDAHALREALRVASRAGVPREELDAAERGLGEAWVQSVRRELQQAMQGTDARVLQAALRMAAEAGLPRDELDRAERAAEGLESKVARARAAQREL